MTRRDARLTERWVLALTSLGALMVALDALVVAAAFSTIRRDLHASIDQLQWTANAYTISLAMLLMVAAVLGDRWGRRRMFVGGLAVFTAASAACALAPDIGTLIAARTVQGAGAAFVMPMAIGLLNTAFPPERRGWANGIFSGITGIGVLAGPVLGGAVTQGLAWQWIFWINVPIGVVAIALIRWRITESKGTARRIDVLGTFLIALGALAVIWGVVRGPSAGWSSTEVATALILGGVLLVAFVVWEEHTTHPMVPLGLFRDRSFAAGNAAGFLLTGALFGAVFFMAQYMHAVFGSGPLESGVRLLPWTGTLFVVAPVAGRLVDRVGARPLGVLGLTLQAAGMFWIGHVPAGSGYGAAVLPMVMAGLGVSMALPAAQAAVTGAVPPQAIGLAGGIYAMMRQCGGAVGVALTTAVFASAGGYPVFGHSITRALDVSAVLSLAGALAGLVIAPRTARAPLPAPGGASHHQATESVR